LWRQPLNPIGWILIVLGVYTGVITDIGRYAVFDYHFHHGDLPFGPAAALLETGLWTGTFLLLPLVILLFPDGHLPPRWRLVLWAYAADAGLVAAYFLGAAAWATTRQRVAVDGAGQLIKQPNPPELTAVAVVLVAALPVFWASFVARQVLSWRRATGERSQQLKWLMSEGCRHRSWACRDFRVQLQPVPARPGDRLVLRHSRPAGRHHRRDLEVPAV